MRPGFSSTTSEPSSTDVHRFTHPAEAAATVYLRHGDTQAIGHYDGSGRLHGGSRDDMLDTAYGNWLHDINNGKRSLLIAATGQEVIAMNHRAHLDRLVT